MGQNNQPISMDLQYYSSRLCVIPQVFILKNLISLYNGKQQEIAENKDKILYVFAGIFVIFDMFTLQSQRTERYILESFWIKIVTMSIYAIHLGYETAMQLQNKDNALSDEKKQIIISSLACLILHLVIIISTSFNKEYYQEQQQIYEMSNPPVAGKEDNTFSSLYEEKDVRKDKEKEKETFQNDETEEQQSQHNNTGNMTQKMELDLQSDELY